ncbi:MAG: NAD(P)/FAD-dependent oxidoreductase [Thermodesulfobacteriota bacterium]
MRTFDVIIIGAGPAGATCARTLARRGTRVLLLDRERFPRSKPCGGGFSRKAKDLFDFDLTPAIEADITRTEISLRSLKPTVISSPEGAGFMVTRGRFDALLVKKAVEDGAELHEQESFVALHPEKNGWVVRTDRDRYYADFLVGADGAVSRTARCLGLMQSFDRYAPALTAEVEVSPGQLEPVNDLARFDFHVVKKGYAWIFPKSDHLSVGVFSTSLRPRGLNAVLLRYINDHDLLRGKKIRYWKGGLIPRGGTRRILVNKTALLAGDAAAMPDPFFGEGIYYAARSGMMAAEAIAKAAAGGTGSLEHYQTAVNREITRDLWWARVFNFGFYRFPFAFYPAIRKSAHLQQLIISINNGRITWKQGVAEMVRTLPLWMSQTLLP